MHATAVGQEGLAALVLRRNRRSASIDSRFWPKVDRNGPVVRAELGPCWVWIGSLKDTGYGQLSAPHRGVPLKAHRVSWELHHGPIPDGLWVLHRCDNRRCVRPDHLWLGTDADNKSDMEAKGRRKGPPIVSVCINGHPYDEANTGKTGGRKRCRACAREDARRRRASRKTAA